MPFVLDASVVACWAFDNENHPTADLARSRNRSEDALAPALLWFEVWNSLLINERRKRITEMGTREFLGVLAQMRIIVDRSPDEVQLLNLARTYKLSIYDASYLELAQRERLPLATLDRDLAKAAQVEGVALLGG